MPITLSILLYGLAWALRIRGIRLQRATPTKLFAALVAAALLAHAVGAFAQLVTPAGYDFGIFKISSLFFWVTNLLILGSSLRKPLHNLFLITLPLTIIAQLLTLYVQGYQTAITATLPAEVVIHIFISILAYSTMMAATVQTLLLAFQNYQLRHKHPTGLVRLLPPLQTMETLLFELLWVGQLLLTLVIISGLFHINDIAAQHLAHKIVFTVIAWAIYAILLWGRHYLGWRGNSAIRWSLAGFASLVLAYLGTQLVLQLVLGEAA